VRHPTEEVLGYLKGARDLKILLVGETIIDEYQYCETLGKSGKEPILAAQFVRSEKFVGGALAVANHVASLCTDVRLVTMLGSHDSHEDLIRDRLSPRVATDWLILDGAPTLVKRRFI